MARRSSGQLHLDGFDDLALLGRGGFSEVYRARQLGFDRWVAIKVLDVGLDDRQRTAFERECRAMGVVSQHPNIVTVLSAAYTDDGRPAIVMELYGGGTYAQRLREDGALPPEEVLELGIRLSGALQTAHDHGVVHRDVKPPNIYRSDYGEPALGDFGISTLGDDDSGAGGLTVHYAAPEVIEDGQSGPVADVYSLAATLYTLVPGRRPFAAPGGGAGEVADVALRILREPPPRIGGRCPPGLERVLLHAMAKQPLDRPVSAASFGRLLQEVQDHLGTSRTPLAVPTDARRTGPVLGGGNVAGAGGGRDLEGDESATVARPITDRSSPSSTPEADDVAVTASRNRRVRSVVVGSLAIAAVLGTVLALGAGERSLPAPGAPPAVDASEVDASVAEDDYFVRVEPPDDVRVVRSDDGEVVVTWTPSEGLRYELERVDTGGDGATLITAVEGEVVLSDLAADAAPCVIVRAISVAGQLSVPSSPACLGGG